MNLPFDETNPYQTNSVETIFDSPWIRVKNCHVLNPAQIPTEYSLVEFKRVAVGIVALDDNFNTWIVGQYRYPIKKYSWEIIEGGSEPSEDPLETAKRELKEEAGLTATHWEEILHMELSNATTDERAKLYVATGITIGDAEPEPGERLQLKKVPFEQLYQWVLEGVVCDALSVAAVLRVKLMLEKGEL